MERYAQKRDNDRLFIQMTVALVLYGEAQSAFSSREEASYYCSISAKTLGLADRLVNEARAETVK